jgi:hypothetical protein
LNIRAKRQRAVRSASVIRTPSATSDPIKRLKALMHYSRSEFSRRHAAFDRANVNTRTRWSEVDLVDLGHMLTRELPIQEIAIHLCRSPADVRGKIAELGRASKDDPSREIIIVNERLHR